MKVLLFNGPSQDSCDRFFGWPTSLLYAISPTVHDIRSGNLKAEIIGSIYDPIWYEKAINAYDIHTEFREKIVDVDVVCASATYDSLHPTLELLREAKKIKAKIITILGGPHVDEVRALPQINELTTEASPVDIIVSGDGEYVLRDILRNISTGCAPLNNIDMSKGMAWVWTKGMTTFVKTCGESISMDLLPFIPIEYANLERHKNDFDIFSSLASKPVPTVQMIAQRGCQYNCSFCSEGSNLAKPNPRSVKNIMSEIELRKSQGFQAIFFDDSTFGTYKHLKDFLHQAQFTDMQFGSLNRFNCLLDPHVVEQYRKAGFVYFYCAIEQFSDAVLSRMRKNISTQTINITMNNLHEHGISLGVSLLYGLPYETKDSIKATIEFVAEWVSYGVIKIVSESVLSLHPGTDEGSHLISGFDRTPPNLGSPFNRFEEGQWYHHPHVTPEYLEYIVEMSERYFGDALARNRHSWYHNMGLIRR